MSARNRWLDVVMVALVATAVTAPAVGGAASSEPAGVGVGVVAEYRPASGRFTFTRQPGAETVPVQIGSVVMAGDRVTLPAGASMSVQLANGETASFKGPGTFAVPAAPPLGKLAAIFQSMSALLDDDYRLAGTAASRGGETCGQGGNEVKSIDVPILVPGASLVAGERDLPLAWRGGCPPFVVKVLSGKDSLVHRESIEGWQVRLDDVPLSVGSLFGRHHRRWEQALRGLAGGRGSRPAAADRPGVRHECARCGRAGGLAGGPGRWPLASRELRATAAADPRRRPAGRSGRRRRAVGSGAAPASARRRR